MVYDVGEVPPERPGLSATLACRPVLAAGERKVVIDGPDVLAHVVLVPVADGDGRIRQLGRRVREGVDGHN